MRVVVDQFFLELKNFLRSFSLRPVFLKSRVETLEVIEATIFQRKESY